MQLQVEFHSATPVPMGTSLTKAEIGAELRRRRKERDLTQEEVARALKRRFPDMRVTHGWVSNAEKGQKCRWEAVQAYAELMGLDVEVAASEPHEELAVLSAEDAAAVAWLGSLSPAQRERVEQLTSEEVALLEQLAALPEGRRALALRLVALLEGGRVPDGVLSTLHFVLSGWEQQYLSPAAGAASLAIVPPAPTLPVDRRRGRGGDGGA